MTTTTTYNRINCFFCKKLLIDISGCCFSCAQSNAVDSVYTFYKILLPKDIPIIFRIFLPYNELNFNKYGIAYPFIDYHSNNDLFISAPISITIPNFFPSSISQILSTYNKCALLL